VNVSTFIVPSPIVLQTEGYYQGALLFTATQRVLSVYHFTVLSTSLIGIVSWGISREKVVSPDNNGNGRTLGTCLLVVFPWLGSLFIASCTLGSSLSNYSESETVNGNSSSVESHSNSTDSPLDSSCTLVKLQSFIV